MNQLETTITILADILDLDPAEILPETYVVRDLGAESIDLLEIGVAMQTRLDIEVDDDTLFLRDMRTVLRRAERAGEDAIAALGAEYPHLTPQRLREMLDDLPAGPVLQVRDIAAYALAAGGPEDE